MLSPVAVLGPEGLADPASVVGHHRGGGLQDQLGGAVVLLQLDDPGAREVPLELQDVVDVRPPETVDRLVLVPHAEYVPVPRRQRHDETVLGVVGVLVFVHEEIAAGSAPPRRHLGVLLEKLQGTKDQIVEVHGIRGPQALGVRGVNPSHGFPGGRGMGGKVGVGAHRQVLGVADGREEAARWEGLVVDTRLFLQIPHQGELVGVVVDDEASAVAEAVSLAPEDPEAQGVEGGDPRAAAGGPQEIRHPRPHLVGGLVGEGHRENLLRKRVSGGDEVGHPVDDDPGLPGARPGQDQQGSVGSEHRLLLAFVQVFEGHSGASEQSLAEVCRGRQGKNNTAAGRGRAESGRACFYSTVTLLARLRGWSTSHPRRRAM